MAKQTNAETAEQIRELLKSRGLIEKRPGHFYQPYSGVKIPGGILRYRITPLFLYKQASRRYSDDGPVSWVTLYRETLSTVVVTGEKMILGKRKK